MFVVFARKDGAWRFAVDWYSKNNTHPLRPPPVLFTRVFLGVVSATKENQKYPQATPTKITPGIQQ
jgi:hypothetical protein